MISDLTQAFEGPFDGFLSALRKRLSQLGVRMVNDRVVPVAEADAHATEVMELVRGTVLPRLAERPGDALRVLDALRGTGFAHLEHERTRCERERDLRYPPPPAATWRELAELRRLAAAHPAHCRLGPPATHIEFAARLEASGCELPRELLALYAATSHLALDCLHVAAPAGSICAGDALRTREGRIILFDRVKRHPANQMVDHPGISVLSALGTWWLVLEDARAPAVKRPLDLQGMLRFALRRMEAPTFEVLLTDLAWQRFFV
ncbi:MAG TPA: hypothetical protein VLM79_04535 [Kofleriaceae bacterium]|nr:hypothetical protein [Kofleriaceae bacterium]